MVAKSNAPDRPLTVLMTADTVGGVWSYAIGLCQSLPEFCFVLATMGPPAGAAQRDEIAGLRNSVLVESDYSLEWMEHGAADFLRSRDWLVEIAERHDVDVIHVNGYAHARLGSNWPVLLVAHSDVLSWWRAVHQCAAPPEWGGYRGRVIAGLAAANRVVAPTAAALLDLEHNYLPLGRSAEVVSNGIEIAEFGPLPKCPVVLAAGRLWDAAKNLAGLDAVAPRLAWPVAIAGDAEHPDSGTADFSNVRLLGRLSRAEFARHLGSAPIFAAPARYEPFGLTILEAAAAGCALVLGDISSLRENWDGAAVFVDPENRSTLQAAINALIADGEQRSRLAAAARRRAGRFTLQRMAQAYAALYRDLAQHYVRLETA
jgi:glycogen synthase